MVRRRPDQEELTQAKQALAVARREKREPEMLAQGAAQREVLEVRGQAVEREQVLRYFRNRRHGQKTFRLWRRPHVPTISSRR